MSSGKQIKSAGTELIRGTLFTLIGFCFWQAAELVQSIAFAGTSAASAAAAVTGIALLIILSSAFGAESVMDLCGKYAERKQWNTLMRFRILSGFAVLFAGFAAAAVNTAVPGRIAAFLLQSSGTEQTVLLARSLVFLAPAWLLIPLLYHCRAFNEGIGLHRINVLSQLIENGLRLLVAFFLLFGRGTQGESSRFLTVLSCGVWLPSTAALLLYAFFDAGSEAGLNRKCSRSFDGEDSFRILRRWIGSAAETAGIGTLTALPAVLSMPVILYTGSYVSISYAAAEQTMLLISFYGRVLCGTGMAFCAAAADRRLDLVSEARERKQNGLTARRIERYFCAVLYALFPCTVAGIVLAETSALTLFSLTADAVSWFRFCAVQGFLETAAAAAVLLNVVLQKRKEAVEYMSIGFAVRYVSWFLLMRCKGFDAAMASGWIASGVTAYLCVVQAANRYELRMHPVLLKAAVIIYAALCMNGVLVIFRILKGNIHPESFPAKLMLAAAAAGAAGVYFLVTWLLKVTEAVFGRK